MLTFIVFGFFFHQGYTSKKKSGGFFMLFSGFVFLYFSLLSGDMFSMFVSVLMAPFALFIILMGIMKAFYTSETQE
jgi:uncharacterized membrane protein HdeD (DUF308 family)